MRQTMSLTFLAVLLSALSLPATQAQTVTDEQIGRAIDQLKEFLYSRQDRTTGGWFGEYHAGPNDVQNPRNVGGPSAMALFGLISAGESPQDPRVERGLRYLREVNMAGTYAIAVRAHVWSFLPDSYMPLLERDAQWLLNAHSGSLFDYGDRRTTRVDHSTTQYGILGLWQFAKRGGRVPRNFWEDAAKHFVEVQHPTGGWTYSLDPDRRPTLTMTCAGLTVLYIAQQELFRDANTPPRALQESIARGIEYMDKNYSAGFSAHSGNGYYIYGVERVGLASGIKFFRDRDWFSDIAHHAVGRVSANGIGGSIVNSSFTLAFLARGRVPVWVTKLEIPDKTWNNRPNDLYFLTQYLSDLREQELNFQAVSIERDPMHWINAPLAYLSSPDAIELTDQQKANLKKFFDLGGTLLASAEGGSARFAASIQQLAQELYPQYPMRRITNDHLAYTAVHRLERGSNIQPIEAVNNGARDIILLTRNDWSRTFQMDTRPGQNDLWKVIFNIYAMVSDRGALTPRVDHVVEPVNGRAGSGSVRVARASYEGNWLPEPGIWTAISNRLINRASLSVTVEDVPLENLAQSNASFVHLAGIEPIELTEEQKSAIRQYVEGGGTILVETIGGRGDFSIEINRQLRQMFGAPAVPLQPASPIISGRGLNNAYRLDRVDFRRYAILNTGVGRTHRLDAFMVNDRPAVVISNWDLSHGAMHLRHMGVNGYQTESALQIFTNLLLYARQQKS